MSDKVFHFGKNRSLVGILSEPDENEMRFQKTALIILNSGLLHRVGPNRIYVKIARDLASEGMPTFRFDFSGVGDSEKRRDNLLFEKSSILETQDAMAFLQKARGYQNFMLTGICSGADVAFQTARQDSRISGVIPIDFYSLPTTGYLLHSYKKRLIHARSWANLITGKSEILRLVKKSINNLALLRTAQETEHIDEQSRTEIENDLAGGFSELLNKGVRLCLIYSAGSPAFYNYELIFENHVKALSSNGKLQIHYLDTADHGFTLLYHQERLLQTIREWVLNVSRISA